MCWVWIALNPWYTPIQNKLKEGKKARRCGRGKEKKEGRKKGRKNRRKAGRKEEGEEKRKVYLGKQQARMRFPPSTIFVQSLHLHL